MKHSILSCLALISLPGLAQATDWTVPPGASIQVFIDVASPGDRIFVEPGTYPGGISFRGKDVEVLSIGGPEVTTIDGTGLPLPSVSCFSGETTAARLALGDLTKVAAPSRHRSVKTASIYLDNLPDAEGDVSNGLAEAFA